MLLRHTASMLALAAMIGLGGSSMNGRVGVTVSTPTSAALEIGAGPGTGLTCLGCVAGGVVLVASGGVAGVWATLMAGGTAAVTLGGAAVTCTTACISYFAE